MHSTWTQPARAFFFTLLFASTTIFTTFSFASDGNIEVVHVQQIMNDGFWGKLKQKFYQTMFQDAGDIETKLLEQNFFKLSIRFGRVLLDYDDESKFSLADHFGLTLKASVPVGGIFRIGGHLGSNLLRIRDIPRNDFSNPGPHLKQDLAFWDPRKPVSKDIQSAYLQNIGTWFDQIEKEVKYGRKENARRLFGNDVPERKYRDSFPALKLPFEMPWTAERVMNNEILKPTDIASFETDGGIFARVEANWGGIKGPWLGVFLRGHFRTTVLKVTDTKIILRVETAKQYGTDWALFDSRFKIPIADGLIFGSDLKVGIKPISIRGENYRSKLFARIYEMHLTNERVKKAYNAAVHGNLTLLDDLGKEQYSGVVTLSERFEEGLHNRRRVHVNLLFIKIQDDMYTDVINRQFWDDRGEFHQYSALGLLNSYSHFLFFDIAEARNSEFKIDAFPRTPEGIFYPRIDWRLEKVNPSVKSTDRTSFKSFIMGFKPDIKESDLLKYLKRNKLRASAEIQIHPSGFEQLQSLSSDQIWKNASRILFDDEKIWSTNIKRTRWLSDNTSRTIRHPTFGNLGPAESIYNRVNSIARFLMKKPGSMELSKWYTHQMNWAHKSNWKSFMPRLMLDAVSPQNRYIELELESDLNQTLWSWSEGAKDLTIYPDDWESISIPELD